MKYITQLSELMNQSSILLAIKRDSYLSEKETISTLKLSEDELNKNLEHEIVGYLINFIREIVSHQENPVVINSDTDKSTIVFIQQHKKKFIMLES